MLDIERKKYNEFDVNLQTLKEAKKLGLSLSEYLEKVDPSEQYDNALGELNALERQLYKKGIVLSHNPSKGLVPTKLSTIFDSDDTGLRLLFAEYVYAKAKETLFTADRYNLGRIVANTRYIDGAVAEVLSIDYSNIEDKPKFILTPGAEIPTVVISWGTEVVRLAKSGVAFEFTDEFVRRARIDMVSKLMERMSISDKRKHFNYAVKEGLFNGTTVENVSAYGVAAGSYIDYQAWLKWLNSFGEYTCDVVFADINSALKIVLMDKPNLAPGDVLNALMAAKANNEPYVSNVSNLQKSPEIMIIDDGVLPANTIVGIDSRFALEHLIENGSELQALESFARKGVKVLTVSLYDGYTKFMPDAVKSLNIYGA